ncbi:inheritance of peroxisomes protein 1-domain-containing protein [Truncatella angustata]|uniref:Inheritance of peroxisomes protein 1 n=1 Tax=Truncatella angustata TaxID=152316 RepID=A0A9P8UHA1_9PEZI|nr:inheritance of peroxisomes protein 1-domain-containing protein [Truncatella angustata]KAH6652093.1 inheritance of peroxisomes protein 1-domain-containing protein [Truncatella angustata]
MEAQVSVDTRFLHPRRVATEPAPLQPLRRSLSVSSTSSRSGFLGAPKLPDESIETLYNHPSVKIIAFTTSQRTSFAAPQFPDEPAPGSLPPSSQLERTIAVGPFRIYRAPGSVAFLNCGSALQPILPKSQCWSIDEANSHFVLQIRRPQYWRIEVPVSDPEDAHRALILREVLDSILLFEKTECPFQRSFTVQLPQRPQTPVKKKPWTAAGKNLISAPFSANPSLPLPAAKIVNEKRRPNPGLPAPTELLHKEGRQPEETALASATPTTGTLGGGPSPKEVAKFLDDAADNTAAETTAAETTAAETTAAETTAAETTAAETTAADPMAEQVTREFGELRPTTVPIPKGIYHTSQPTTATLPIDNPEMQSCVQPEPVVQPDRRLSQRSHSSVVNLAPSVTLELSSQQIAAPSVIPATVPLLRSAISEHIPGKTNIPSVASAGNLSSRALHGNTSSCPSLSYEIPAVLDSEHTKPIIVDDSLVKGEEAVAGYTKDADPHSFEGAGSVGAVSLKKKRMSRILAGRSVTIPPHLTVVTSPPSKSTQPMGSRTASTQPLEYSVEPLPEEASPVGSMDSFHSVQSWHSPITPNPPSPPSSSPSPPSFPYPHENIILPSKSTANLTSADITPVTDATLMPSSTGATTRSLDAEFPASFSAIEESEATNANLPLPLESSGSSSFAYERPGLEHRRKSTNLSISRRAFSPLPPAANLFSPSRRQPPASRLAAVGKLPSAIIHKTVEILLSPPGHLVNLMLKVAAKIAAGEWRGLVFGLGEGGESIPVHWDYSDGELSSWEDDDDYHFSIGRLTKTPSASHNSLQEQSSIHMNRSGSEDHNDRSWEVD